MVKKRQDWETKTYDENGNKRRAACVCFKDEREQQMLLITSKHYTDARPLWLCPGGSIEPDEDPEDAAEREVFEEGGVKGRIIRSLGQVVNKRNKTKTWVYVMIHTELVEPWQEGISSGRRRKWFNLEKAKELLSQYKPVQQKYIDLARTGQEILPLHSAVTTATR